MSLAPDHAQGSRLLEGAERDGRGARLVARTLFQEMQRSGFTRGQVLAVADELLGCLCATASVGEQPVSASDSWEPDGTGD